MTVIRNPKLGTPERRGLPRWYPYYAGYSREFVEDAIDLICLPDPSLLLDPWNGSGTTTTVAAQKGYSAIGFDLNPALVLVAKGRLLDKKVLPSISAITSEIISTSKNIRKSSLNGVSEPLLGWFSPSTASCLRSLERATYHILIDGEIYEPIFSAQNLSHVSTLAAFYYVALFRTVRSALTSFRTSNPTWVKTHSDDRKQVGISGTSVFERFRFEIRELLEYLESYGFDSVIKKPSEIEIASSEIIPLKENSVNGVLSSPPYCTRIDYIVATLPELAVIGCGEKDTVKRLRAHMMGTPTMRDVAPLPSNDWGSQCNFFLGQVKNHRSRASGSYYYRYFLQYFDSLWRSLKEIERVVVPSGPCALVVQDSYYKEIHNDIGKVIREMGSIRGWEIEKHIEFPVSQSMANINIQSKKYKKKRNAVESFILFRISKDWLGTFEEVGR